MEYQEQADNFEGAQALLAAALGTQVASTVILGDMFKHGHNNPDPKAIIPKSEDNSYLKYVNDEDNVPDPNFNKTRKDFEAAAEPIAQRYNPGYTNKMNLRRGADHKIQGGSTARWTKDHLPDLVSDEVWRIAFNPAHDRAAYAHELGHMISQNSEVGMQIANLKHQLNNNRPLGEFLNTQMARMPAGVAAALAPVMTSPKMLAAGRLALPTAIAAAIPGDDDAMAAVAANLALSSPELIDEFLASKNALEVMKDAGMPATFKQRARMAGAFGTYLAKPLTNALIGNVAGNVIEDTI